MEYVPGVDLEQMIQQRRQRSETFSCDEALRLLRPVAEALDYAHRKNVIHRDVKPANILVGESGHVVLTDFGLAMDVNRGSLGEIFGSPRYIAPEQARDSSAASPASDLYSLGVMLYELLTGSPPFDDPSPTALALQHIMLEPPPPRSLNPNLSQAVEQVLLKALRKEPARRYRSGKELIAALEKALESHDPGETPLTARPTPGRLPSHVVERMIGRLRLQAHILEEQRAGCA
jgi:serine/threonine-protein kinase